MEQLNEEIRKHFVVLGFDSFTRIPPLKDVKSAFHDKAKETHPDKHMKKEEEIRKHFQEMFKEILNSYNIVSKFIVENVVEEEDDSEETLARKEFEDVNIVVMNKTSVTISIPKEHLKSWIFVLKQKYGNPTDRSKKNNGYQFKTETNVSITVWEKVRDNHSTMFINGNLKEYINFLENKIPQLFQLVLDQQTKLPERSRHSSLRKSKCDQCDFRDDKARLKIHIITAHNKFTTKRRSLKSSRKILPRKSKIFNEKQSPYVEDELPEDKSILKVDDKNESDEVPDQVDNETRVGEYNENDADDDVEMIEIEDIAHEKTLEPTEKNLSEETLETTEKESEKNYNEDNGSNEKETNTSLNEQGTQTDDKNPDICQKCSEVEMKKRNDLPEQCNKCQEMKTKHIGFIADIAKVRANKVLLAADLDVKKRRLKQITEEMAKLKEENESLKRGKDKILKALKNYIQGKKDNEDVINTLTKRNTELENENKTLNKLYEEEKNSKSESKGNQESNHQEFVDYDNLIDGINDDEEEDVIQEPVTRTENKTKQKACTEKCNYCKFTAIHRSLVMQHMKECHSFKCTKCDFIAENKEMLQQHNTRTHGKQNNTRKQPTLGNFPCEFCEHKSNSAVDLNIHEHKMHRKKTIKCNLCDFNAKDEEILKKHHKVAMGHTQNTPCKFFLRGFCRNGRLCKFSHKMSYRQNKTDQRPKEGYSQFNSFEERQQGMNNYRQCKYRENCYKFPNCGFVHAEICKFQEKCFNPGQCRYVHLPEHFLGMYTNHITKSQ